MLQQILINNIYDMLADMPKEKRLAFFEQISKPKDLDFVKEMDGIYYVVCAHFDREQREDMITKVYRHKGRLRIFWRLEYCGHTVNFRATTRSFKDKTMIRRPKEEWKIFENTHEAIIDNETWELVQELRSHKRRSNRTGEISIFSGLLYCADCGEKLYYSVTNNYSREQAYFFCSNYRKTFFHSSLYPEK